MRDYVIPHLFNHYFLGFLVTLTDISTSLIPYLTEVIPYLTEVIHYLTGVTPYLTSVNLSLINFYRLVYLYRPHLQQR